MSEKVVEVQWQDKTYKVTVGTITYGQRNAILSACMKMKIERGQYVGDIDYAKMEQELIVYAIKKVEPDVGMPVREWVKLLDVSEAMKLVAAAMELNPLLL